jgi:hypothetical protein
MQKQKLNGRKEWHTYCRSGENPNDIPNSPDKVYANVGWKGMDDWLGTGRRRRGIGWRSFAEGRRFVHNLKLKSFESWQVYCLSKKKPNDIPADPRRLYADQGWISWSDWLGNGYRPFRVSWRPFNEARCFVQKLKLKSLKDWRSYCRSGRKPNDIPANPPWVYSNSGWSGWRDWLDKEI